MKSKTKINVRLLRRIQKQILKEPRQFDMSWWFTRNRDKIPNCGTAACIAGWAVALANKWKPEKARQQSDGYTDEEAIGILGITQSQANQLFYAEYWPYEFRQGTWNDPKQAVARIEHFIKTGE